MWRARSAAGLLFLIPACGAQAGLSGHWLLDEGSGATAADASGNGCTGTVHGAAWVSGVSGSALSFDGTDDYLDVADHASLDFTTQMTVAAWVRLDAASAAWITVAQKSTASWFLWQLYARASDATPSFRPAFRIDFDSDGILDAGEEAAGSAILSTGSWTHLAGVYNGQALLFYQNGALAGSNAASATIPANDHAVWFGRNEIWSEPLDGALDDLRLYSHALSAAEVQALFSEGAVNTAPSVDAGLDRSITWPTNSLTLAGSVTDDGLPAPPGVTTALWTQVGGPGGAAFGSSSSATGSVTFSTNGSYVLRLSAYDGGLSAYDELTVTVYAPGEAPTGAARRIYLAPDNHTDYFWSAGEADYSNSFVRMIDYYLDQADATSNNPSGHQSRWNCDGSFWLWTYERHTNAAGFDRLIGRIRDGHFSAPLNALVSCPGGAPAEAVLRGMYYAGSLERRYGLRFPVAIAMENQVLPCGLPSLWAGAGARYSWKGICGCDTRVWDAYNRDQEIYWAAGPDGRRVLMKWNSMMSGNESLGGYAEARYPEAAIDYVTVNAPFNGFTSRYPYAVIGVFGQGWDDLETLNTNILDACRAKSDTNRDCRVSNQVDFFEDFDARYGTNLPALTLAYGNEWDLYAAAFSEVSARIKRSTEKLRSVEALVTLASLDGDDFATNFTALRDRAWMNMGLFYEHNMGMAGPPSGLYTERGLWQKRLASEIEEYLSVLETATVARVGALIASGGTSPRFFVFNPLGWRRTDYADLPSSAAEPLHVADLTEGRDAPFQFVTRGTSRWLRVWATDVPSFGYKVYEIRAGAGESFGDAASVSGAVIENDRYRVAVNGGGAITSLVDKLRGSAQLARPVGGRWMNDLGGSAGAVWATNLGPVSATLVATGAAPLARATEITLFRDSPRIDIRNEIRQNFDGSNTWAFGFNLDQPRVWHEEVGAVLLAKLTNSGGHYSPRAARYDWLTLNHFADVSGSNGLGVTLGNADGLFMQVGDSSVSALDTNTPSLNVLAGGRVCNGNNGLLNQLGDTNFLQRFALRTHGGYDAVAAMRFALEHQNPLVAAPVTGGGTYPATTWSLLSISDSNILAWAVKPHEDGMATGVVVRAWNLGGGAVTARVALARRALSAQRISHVETIEAPLAVEQGGAVPMALGAREMATILVQPGASPTDADGDGLTDESEVRAGTNPFDAASGLRLFIEFAGDSVTNRWTSVAGRRYRMQWATGLLQAAWSDLPDTVTATGAVTWLPDTNEADRLFYRVRLEE